MQAGMYGTPVIYSLTYILDRGQASVAKYMMLNPMAQIIQDIRHFIVYEGNPRGWDVIAHKPLALIPYVLPLVIFLVGLAIFKKNATRFAEIL